MKSEWCPFTCVRDDVLSALLWTESVSHPVIQFSPSSGLALTHSTHCTLSSRDSSHPRSPPNINTAYVHQQTEMSLWLHADVLAYRKSFFGRHLKFTPLTSGFRWIVNDGWAELLSAMFCLIWSLKNKKLEVVAWVREHGLEVRRVLFWENLVAWRFDDQNIIQDQKKTPKKPEMSLCLESHSFSAMSVCIGFIVWPKH